MNDLFSLRSLSLGCFALFSAWTVHRALLRRQLFYVVPKDFPLRGSTILVTGATGGIGKEICRQIHQLGGNLILAVRNTEAGRELQEELEESWKRRNFDISFFPRILVAFVDFNDLNSIVQFTQSLEEDSSITIDQLINNIAIITRKPLVSLNWYEKMIQINFLGQTLLMERIKEKIIKRKEETRGNSTIPIQIIQVSSRLEGLGNPLEFEDFLTVRSPEGPAAQEEKEKILAIPNFSGFHQYGNTKLYGLSYSNWWNHLLNDGRNFPRLAIHNVTPGMVPTGIDREYPWYYKWGMKIIQVFITNTPARGASAIVALVLGGRFNGESGRFYGEGQEIATSEASRDKIFQVKVWKKTQETLRPWLEKPRTRTEQTSGNQ